MFARVRRPGGRRTGRGGQSRRGLAAGATEAQGLNPAGARAAQIFVTVWRLAEHHGARQDSRIGISSHGRLGGDLLAHELQLPRRLLAQDVPAREIPA